MCYHTFIMQKKEKETENAQTSRTSDDLFLELQPLIYKYLSISPGWRISKDKSIFPRQWSFCSQLLRTEILDLHSWATSHANLSPNTASHSSKFLSHPSLHFHPLVNAHLTSWPLHMKSCVCLPQSRHLLHLCTHLLAKYVLNVAFQSWKSQ